MLFAVGVVAGAVVGFVVFSLILVAVVIVVCRERIEVGAGSQPQVVTTSSSSYGGGKRMCTQYHKIDKIIVLIY